MDTSQKVLHAVGGVVVAVVSVVAVRKLFHKERSKEYPRDTVILHQIGRGPYAPSMTPFAVKLETYLRMARIPYQNVHGMQPSPKGKVPWIEYNGQPIGDTTLCIHFLNQKLGVDLNKPLSPADKGRKKFLMGDDPCEADCSLFGMLSQAYWQFNGSGFESLIKGETRKTDNYPNLPPTVNV